MSVLVVLKCSQHFLCVCYQVFQLETVKKELGLKLVPTAIITPTPKEMSPKDTAGVKVGVKVKEISTVVKETGVQGKYAGSREVDSKIKGVEGKIQKNVVGSVKDIKGTTLKEVILSSVNLTKVILGKETDRGTGIKATISEVTPKVNATKGVGANVAGMNSVGANGKEIGADDTKGAGMKPGLNEPSKPASTTKPQLEQQQMNIYIWKTLFEACPATCGGGN